MVNALKSTVESLLALYSSESKFIRDRWKEIRFHYEEPHRHYHNLNHLHHLFQHLETCKNLIQDWELILFALFYHDIIYDVTRHDNEEASAKVAEQVLQELKIQPERIHRCVEHILATKGHAPSPDPDTCFFMDADLSILGSAPEAYQRYSGQIRKEYSSYSDAEYRMGRTKVLNQMLQLPALFKTAFFKDQFEVKARKNLIYEIRSLAGMQDPL